MRRRSSSNLSATAASGLLIFLSLSLVGCPRPIENPADPKNPVAGEPAADTIEPDRPSPGDAGPAPIVQPPRPDPVPNELEETNIEPATPPPMDPQTAPLRV
jgi:hypothetical protein